jgi:hypothetical protein
MLTYKQFSLTMKANYVTQGFTVANHNRLGRRSPSRANRAIAALTTGIMVGGAAAGLSACKPTNEVAGGAGIIAQRSAKGATETILPLTGCVIGNYVLTFLENVGDGAAFALHSATPGGKPLQQCLGLFANASAPNSSPSSSPSKEMIILAALGNLLTRKG